MKSKNKTVCSESKRYIPINKSEAIRMALKELGDVDASSGSVKAFIIEHWPQMKSIVNSNKNWSQIVSMNRRILKNYEMQLNGFKREGSTIYSVDLMIVKQFINHENGDLQRVKKLLEILEPLKSISRISDVLAAWEDLMTMPS